MCVVRSLLQFSKALVYFLYCLHIFKKKSIFPAYRSSNKISSLQNSWEGLHTFFGQHKCPKNFGLKQTSLVWRHLKDAKWVQCCAMISSDVLLLQKITSQLNTTPHKHLEGKLTSPPDYNRLHQVSFCNNQYAYLPANQKKKMNWLEFSIFLPYSLSLKDPWLCPRLSHHHPSESQQQFNILICVHFVKYFILQTRFLYIFHYWV